MDAILDVQGFQSLENTFIVKELAIGYVNDSREIHSILFKPPHSWRKLPDKFKRTNTWLTRNYHGIVWNSGQTPYSDVQQVVYRITQDVTTIYVKGLQKKQWLRNILGSSEKAVVNLEDLDCPKLSTLESQKCLNHMSDADRSPYVCAINCVKSLQEWYMKKHVRGLHKSLDMFCTLKSLKGMSTEDISFLPKKFLLLFAVQSIEDAWYELPENLRKDPDIASCRRCVIHHITQPQPIIKNCSACKCITINKQ